MWRVFAVNWRGLEESTKIFTYSEKVLAADKR